MSHETRYLRARGSRAPRAPPLGSRSAVSKYQQVLRELRELGIETVRDITPQRIAEWIRSRPDRKATTWNGLLSYLHAACEYAVAQGQLKRSPFLGWNSHLREDDSEPRQFWSRDQVRRLLEHTTSGAGSWRGGRLNAMAHLYCYTGVRKMEGLTLRWSDVELGQGVLWIAQHVRGKTLASKAPIPMPDRLLDVLRDWFVRCEAPWVVPNVTRTGPWVGGSIGARPIDALARAGEAVGIDGLTFLSLRHTWATMGESAWGLSAPVIQRILRHTTPITQELYRHADAVNLRAAVASITF